MNQKARLRRIESAMGIKGHEPETVEEMTDGALAVLITGDVNAKASDLTDQELEALSAGED